MTQSMKQIIAGILDQHAAYSTWEEVADKIVAELHIKEDSDFSTASMQARIADEYLLERAGLVIQQMTEKPSSALDFKAGYVAGVVDWNVEALQARIAELEHQQGVLVDACQTFDAWLRREEEGFVKSGNKRDTPEGEQRWREWYNENLRLCALAQEQARAALAAVKPADQQNGDSNASNN